MNYTVIPPEARAWLADAEAAWQAIRDTGVRRRQFFLGRDKWLPFPGFLMGEHPRTVVIEPTAEDADEDAYWDSYWDGNDEDEEDDAS